MRTTKSIGCALLLALGLLSPREAQAEFVGLRFGSDQRLFVLSVNGYGDPYFVYIFDGYTGEYVGGFPSGGATLPGALAFDANGFAYVSSYTGNIYRYTPDGTPTGVFASAPYVGPGLAFGPNGDLFATTNNRVVRFDGKTGALVGTFAANVTNGPQGILFIPGAQPGSSLMLVGAANGQFVQSFDGTTGASLGNFTSGAPTISGPSSLALGGPQKNLLIVANWSFSNGGEYALDSTPPGQFVRGFSGIYGPSGIDIGPDGAVYGMNAAGDIVSWDASTGALRGTLVPANFFFAPSPQYKITAGKDHSCALLPDRRAQCWGLNDRGQATPPPSAQFREVIAGDGVTCGLKLDQTIVCWGTGGIGSTAPPAGLFSQIAVGGKHACAIADSSGAISCWGDNTFGQATPPAGAFIDVAAGLNHTCAVTRDAKMLCWGDNSSGQCHPPPKIPFLWEHISAGTRHSCALAGSELYCWGDNSKGQATPKISSDGIRQVTSGDDYSCATVVDGTVLCWGDDSSGKAAPPPATPIAQVSAGSRHSCGIRRAGGFVCWGDNSAGESAPIPSTLTPATPAPLPKLAIWLLAGLLGVVSAWLLRARRLERTA